MLVFILTTFSICSKLPGYFDTNISHRVNKHKILYPFFRVKLFRNFREGCGVWGRGFHTPSDFVRINDTFHHPAEAFVCSHMQKRCSLTAWSGLKAPAEPSCRPALFIFQYHPLWRFFKKKSYLKSSHRLKAISGTLIIIVYSYNWDLITISLRLLKMTINRTGCGL